MGEWNTVRLGDVAQLIKGVSYSSRTLGDTGPEMVGMGDIRPGGGLGRAERRRFTGRVRPGQAVLPGDIAVALTDLTQDGRLLGSPAQLHRDCADGLVVSHHLAVARPTGGLDSRFLYYSLCGPRWRHHVRARCTGTTVRAVSTRDAEDFELDLPAPGCQHAIADSLGALDDKIESNRRLAETIGQVIRLELEGGGDKWPLVPVSSLARFANGGAYTKDASGSGRMVIRIAELNRGPGSSTIYNDLDVPDDQTARAGDLLMSWSGSLGVHRWTGDEAIINQHIFKVIPTDYPLWLVQERLERVIPEFRRIAADKATTMGHIKRHHLEDTKVGVPNPEALGELDQDLGPLWRRSLAAEIESRTLAALRDTLLPELLSGRLRVPEAEDLVSDMT